MSTRTRLRHTIIDEGRDLERFHAAEDRQVDRDRVFEILRGLRARDCRIDSVIVEKRKANPVIRVPERLYCDQVALVLKYQLNQWGLDVRRFDKVLVFLDRPSQRGKAFQAMLQALRTNLPRYLQGVPYELLFHSSASHHGLQMVDYMSWAISIRYERNEQRPYQQIKHLVRSELDVFRVGDGTVYY